MTEEKQSTIDFFISYNNADKTWAEWIAWQLEEAGFLTLLQAWDFRPGTNFVMKMQEASEKAKRTIAVLSPNYLKADFTPPEWAAAFRRDPRGNNSILVPIMVRDCRQELEGLWPQIVYINLVGIGEQAAHKMLLEGINRGRNKPQSPPVFPGALQHDDSEEPQFPGRSRNVFVVKSSDEKPVLPRPSLNRSFNPYKTRDEWIEYITSNLQEATEREASLDFYTTDVQGHRQIRILSNQKTIYSLNIHKGFMKGSGNDEYISFSYAEGRATLGDGFNAWGDFKWDSKKEAVVLKLIDTGMLSHPVDGKEYTKEEFLLALWSKILLAVERSAQQD
jgi:TIR domain